MSSTKVVLIFPPCKVKTFGNNGGAGTSIEKTLVPPLGILYLAAELIDAGYETIACDFNAESYSTESLAAYIVDAGVVGVSVMSFNLAEAFRIIADLKQLRPDLPVIAGGPDLMLRPRYIEGTAATVCHEAETIIVSLVDALTGNGDLARVPGIIFRDADGEVRYGPPFSPIIDIDSFKFPRRDLLRNHEGYSVIGKKRGRLVTTIITSRGCPKRCSFCAHNAVAYRRFRTRSASNVLAEIRQIVAEGYEIIGIVDDNFTADRQRALAVLRGIRDLNTRLSLGVQGRVDAADPELFEAMCEAGVTMITFGLESGNQDVLDFYDKGTTVSQNAAAVRMADKAGLYTGGIFILGAPFETAVHFERTYRFACSLPLDVTTFWVLDYAYGSPLWERARDAGVLSGEEFLVPAGSERGTHAYTTAQLAALCQRFFFRYYTRPSFWLRQFLKAIRVRDKYLVMVFVAGIRYLIARSINILLRRTGANARRLSGKLRMPGRCLPFRAYAGNAATPRSNETVLKPQTPGRRLQIN